MVGQDWWEAWVDEPAFSWQNKRVASAKAKLVAVRTSDPDKLLAGRAWMDSLFQCGQTPVAERLCGGWPLADANGAESIPGLRSIFTTAIVADKHRGAAGW